MDREIGNNHFWNIKTLVLNKSRFKEYDKKSKNHKGKALYINDTRLLT